MYTQQSYFTRNDQIERPNLTITRLAIALNTHCKQAVWEAATICPQPLQVDLRLFDLESGIRVTCDVGYLCVYFSLPRPICSRLRSDVRDRRQTDRQTSDRRQTRIIA